MASFASSATTCGARKHAWTKILKITYLVVALSNKMILDTFNLIVFDMRPELVFLSTLPLCSAFHSGH